MTDFKKFIDYLENNNISKEETLRLLTECNKLTSDEKNLIFLYRYPRNLMDKELPSRIIAYRQSIGLPSQGVLVPHLGETALLIEALRTPQYERFMKHLFIAFCDPAKVSPVSGQEIDECPICGKKIYEHDIWNQTFQGTQEINSREFLSFGSSDSGIIMCLDCMIQLFNAFEILKNINSNFLGWK